MKSRNKITILAAALSLVLLAGCTSAESPAQATPSPDPVVTAAPLPEVTPTPAAETKTLDYDEICSIEVHTAIPKIPAIGYYTMSKDGLWGLMRADGTELLPCTYESPVSSCGSHWIWSLQEPMDWEQFDEISLQLTESGDGALCPGHGGSGDEFYYNLDSPGRDQSAIDLSALRYYAMNTPGTTMPMPEEKWADYGGILPVFSAHEEGEEGDPKFPGEPVTDENGTVWWYICQDGSSLYVPGAKQALWFFEESLAPVELDGSWAYLDRAGNLVTEAKYSPIWGTESMDGSSQPCYAACLRNGYAAVCRDGLWGLLDSSGAEVLPCENQGVAWEGTHLWVKSNDTWQEVSLPR